MKRRETTTRLLFASLVLLALFLILALAAYLSGREVENDSLLISDDAVPGSIDAYAMRTAFTANIINVAAANFAEAPEAKLARLQLARRTDQKFETARNNYETTIRINPEQDRRLLQAVADQWTDFNRKRDVFEARIRAGDLAGSHALFERELFPALTTITRAVDDLVGYNQTNAITFARAIGSNIQTLHWTVAIVLMLALVCGVILVNNLIIRRRENQQLRESERRLRQVLDNLYVFVGLLELDGTIIEVNRSPLGFVGLTREELLGKDFKKNDWWASSAESQGRLQAALTEAAAGKLVRYDAEARVAGGHLVMVDFGCGPIRDATGRVTQLVVTAIDISERKKLEEQFQRAQRMEAIGMLSSGLAHDLNNILAPMLMAAGLLKLKLDSPRDKKIIAMIEGGAQRGAGIIRQLLTFGRGSDGTKGDVQLRHLLADITHIVQATFPRNIELEHDAASDLWPIVAEATQLHQVLLNLCVNARDAMPQGGKLSLRLENAHLSEEDAKVHLQAKSGRYILLTVADTGEGIPPAILNRIFDPFFTTKPVGKGTGLGLSSVLGIVKGHGGFLTVDSEPGQGTEFRVYLPAAEHPAAAPAPEVADHLPRGHGELILLVDDERAMRDATREMLELHNYRVVTTADGEEAIRQFVEHRESVKLVLTDIDMPVMDGPELIRSLRVLESDLRFLPMTGSAQAEIIKELTVLGISELVRKPCDPALLLKTLHRLLQVPPAPR